MGYAFSVKKVRFLISLCGLISLSACSAAKSIGPEEAKELLRKNSDRIAQESFSMPTSLSMKGETTVKVFQDSTSDNSDWETRWRTFLEYDAEKECLSRASIQQQIHYSPYLDETSKGYLYLWKEDGAYFTATSKVEEKNGVEIRSKHTWEELSSEEFHQILSDAAALYFPLIDKEKLIEHLESLSQTIDSFLEQTASNSRGPLEGEAEAKAEFSSSGAGNLTIAFSESESSLLEDQTGFSEVANANEEKEVFDSFLPLSQEVHRTHKVRNNSGEIVSEWHTDDLLEHRWGSCSFQVPDLSQYPEDSAWRGNI